MVNPGEPLPAPPGNADNSANVAGRHEAPPSNGFGQLWRKEFSMTLVGAPPAADLMAYWKEHLHELWPQGGDLYQAHREIRAGDLLGVDVGVGPAKLGTGVVVVESSDTALTLLAPEGHMFAGWNRFTTHDTASGTVAAIEMEFRASDPLYEVGLMLGGHLAEERFWAELLRNLAERFGQRPAVRFERRRLDGRRQWRQVRNVRQNAFLRTTARRLARLFRVGGR